VRPRRGEARLTKSTMADVDGGGCTFQDTVRSDDRVRHAVSRLINDKVLQRAEPFQVRWLLCVERLGHYLVGIAEITVVSELPSTYLQVPGLTIDSSATALERNSVFGLERTLGTYLNVAECIGLGSGSSSGHFESSGTAL
jgi:hypothetical protein